LENVVYQEANKTADVDLAREWRGLKLGGEVHNLWRGMIAAVS
jgi:hypothetical protein